MNVLVLGSAGQLGQDVMAAAAAARLDTVGLTHADVEVTDPESVRAAILAARPSAVVNCAAYVRVEECELEVTTAFAVNAAGALHVARAAAAADALCVYISTDYVFDGEKVDSYTKDDVPSPINVYGASKLAGEVLTRQASRRSLIVRVSSLFGHGGSRAKGGNFVDKILAQADAGRELCVPSDVHISPTYSKHAAEALVQLLVTATTGTVHLVNSGHTTWYGLASTALRLAGFESRRITPLVSHETPSGVRRPRNSSLATRHREGPASRLPPWEVALSEYVRERQSARSTMSKASVRR